MPVFSKLAYNLGQPILEANCYEVIHTWDPNCYIAIWKAVPNGVRFALKTYVSFYLLANVVSKKGRLDKINWQKVTRDIFQSSAFLVTNMILFLLFLCKMRHILGFFTPVSMGFITSIAASAIAILIEKKSRRPALALYLTNLASETYYRHLSLHGYVPTYKYGECVPFGIGLMLFTYLQSTGRLPSSFNGILNTAIKSKVTGDVVDTNKLPENFQSFLHKLRSDYEKTELCEHAHSCVSHSVEGFTKNFTMGLIASTVLTLARSFSLILKNPSKLVPILLSKQTFKLPLFAGLLPLLFNATRCSLNRVKIVNPVLNNVFSAGVSALSMIYFPNVSIAMYCLWKGIETLYFDLMDKGYLPKVKYGEVVLYAIATGYVLWNVIVEPRAIRRGYLNFLSGLVGGKLALFNRHLYDHFGYISRDIYNAYPSLDTKYVTLNPMLYQPIIR